MAWNGSDNGKAKVEGQGKAKAKGQGNSSLITPRSSLKRAALAGTLVVLGGALAIYMVLGRTPAPESAAPQKAPPKKSVPAKLVLPPTNVVEVAEKPRKTKKELDDEFIRRCEAQYGDNMPAGLKTHIYYLKNPPKDIYQAERDYPYLKNTADRGIAGVLYVKPGTFFIDCPEFNSKFDEAFAEALVNPLKIENDDPDDVRDVKQFVNDMKHEIADIVRTEGKKPSELMNEQARILYDLGRFEEQLAENLREAEEDPNLTDDDVKDMFAAANELRKKKGLEEREVPTLTHRALDLKRAARRRAREAAKKEAEANAAK